MDLDAYFERIGYAGVRAPAVSVLAALHEAHAGTIPFENIDVLLGRTPSLEPDAIFAKLVTDRRGGWCFEHNLLFQEVLENLGFAIRPLAARVLWGRPGVPAAECPRTHMLMLAEAEGRTFLADVGFGGMGLLEPLPLEAGRVFSLPLVSFRLEQEDGHWVLQANRDGDWIDLYGFTLERLNRIDYVVASHFTATWPQSPLRHMLLAQRVRRDERIVLVNGDLTILRPGGQERREIGSAEEAATVLAERFGLDLRPGPLSTVGIYT